MKALCAIQRACASRVLTVLPHCRSRWEELVAAHPARVATVTDGVALSNLLVSRNPALRSSSHAVEAVFINKMPGEAFLRAPIYDIHQGMH